jgi:hypothetical protein
MFKSFQLFRVQHLIAKIAINRLITSILLNILNYDGIFKSMGRDKAILEGHKYSINSLLLLPVGTILSAEYNKLKF